VRLCALGAALTVFGVPDIVATTLDVAVVVAVVVASVRCLVRSVVHAATNNAVHVRSSCG
jgi:hypothetical protein